MNDKTRTIIWLACLGSVAPSALSAQACLGFGGKGFLSASGAVWRAGSEDTKGIGGAAGLSLGPVAATGRFLKFEGAESDENLDFEDTRATLALKLPIPLLSVCPVVTLGTGGVLSRNFDNLPDRSETVYGIGVAAGQRFGAAGSGVAVIPSLIVSVENYAVDRLFDDIVEGDREVSAVLRAGVTVEVGSILVRPYAAWTTAEDTSLIAGILLGVTF